MVGLRTTARTASRYCGSRTSASPTRAGPAVAIGAAGPIGAYGITPPGICGEPGGVSCGEPRDVSPPAVGGEPAPAATPTTLPRNTPTALPALVMGTPRP